MVGILIILAVSWLLLFITEKTSLLALGFLPLHKRFFQFSVGFLLTAILCTLVQILEASLQSSVWVVNDVISVTTILQALWFDVRSVITEELIFRGALLYILIQKIGPKKSILISSIAFGIYHWFSYGILGNVPAMAFIFIGTGLMGYAWALAFYKTKSILLPIGLHLGWNVTYNTLFSKGPLGDLIFISQGGVELTDWLSLINFVSGLILVPILVLLCVQYFVKSEVSSDSTA